MKYNPDGHFHHLLFLLPFLLCTVRGMAQLQKDSTRKETAAMDSISASNSKENRNVMLNASDANAPREIPIGLPSSNVNVYENGLPVVYSSVLYNVASNWRSESSLKEVGLMDPTESAITTGSVAYSVTSATQLGSDKFKGVFNYNANHFGLSQFDLNVSGGLGKGWLYSGSIYQNYDPGTFKWKFTDLQDKTQFYKGAITKKLGDRGKLAFIYKYSDSRRAGNLDNIGPFIYLGKGKVQEIPGFKLGTSSYLPQTGVIQYMDLLSGNINTTNFRNGMGNVANEYALLSDYAFKNGMVLSFNAKYLHANVGPTDRIGATITDIVNGVEQGSDNKNIYYGPDGNLFTGKKQVAIAFYHQARMDNLLATMELKKNSRLHNWRIGLNEWYYNLDYHSNTTTFDHTVENYPQMISHITPEGEQVTYYNFNAAASEYEKGYENRLALYATDNWKPSQKLEFNYGLRGEFFKLNGTNMPFTRYADIHLGDTNADGDVVTTGNFHNSSFNYAGSLQGTYKITPRFGATADATYAVTHPTIDAYPSSSSPANKPIGVELLRGGFYYRNGWISATSMITYIKKTNYFTFQNLTDPANNNNTKAVSFTYNIQTLGWTTMAELDPFKGFHLHLLLTLQKPEYNNYETSVSFGENTYTVNASGNTVVSISKILTEFDPSYSITDALRLWMSFRYFGKQYANLTNALYFNGHWETFAGVNYTVNKTLSLNASVVNFLNQTGATGTIDGADFITADQASAYNNHWMTGKYLRPFILQFGARINF